eukprot:GILI01017576.1.p1 GENE.GILI01017576.1~~GILI01017576.1.p1  ORF type:complete len:223 (+),score=9.29 GILI01017576.1:38-706(+)
MSTCISSLSSSHVCFNFSLSTLSGKTLYVKGHTADGCPKSVLDSVVEAAANATGVFEDEIALFVRTDNAMVPLTEQLCSFIQTGDSNLFGVFRLRGGKGKAGFQKTLKRKGQDYTRAVRAGQIHNREAAGRNNTQGTHHGRTQTQAAFRQTRVGERFTRARNHKLQRDATAKDLSALMTLNPSHPIELLKTDQSADKARLRMWAEKMTSSIHNGFALLGHKK